MPTGFTSVSLPDELVAQIDKFIKSNKWGYRSRPDVITAAVRAFLRDEMGPP